jgi:hypothetical protein
MCVAGVPLHAADTGQWKLSSYRLLVTLGVDDAARPQPHLADGIVKMVGQRAEALMTPLWAMDIQIATDLATRRQCLDGSEIEWEQLPTEMKAFDKLLWLGVDARPEGYAVSCREFDAYTRRWGPRRQSLVRQDSFVPYAAFHALLKTFSPLAMVEVIPNDDMHVRLLFRGSSLPSQGEDNRLIAHGDVCQPFLRRTDRAGKLAANGLTEIPYTYVVAQEPAADAWIAEVHTGTRRPFAAERRARIDQIAVALHNPPEPSLVRFHARSEKGQGLGGYEVYLLGDDGKERPLGKTDRHGEIAIPANSKGISTVVLRSDALLLAKAPIPTGAPQTIQIPVADSAARLRAQAEAQVLREQLVDVVARRTLMMARVKALLKKGKTKEAAELMDRLDELPSSSVFSRTIDAAVKRIPAGKDPAVNRSIDRLFTATRELLGKFLPNRPIIDLQNEVNSAGGGS